MRYCVDVLQIGRARERLSCLRLESCVAFAFPVVLVLYCDYTLAENLIHPADVWLHAQYTVYIITRCWPSPHSDPRTTYRTTSVNFLKKISAMFFCAVQLLGRSGPFQHVTMWLLGCTGWLLGCC